VRDREMHGEYSDLFEFCRRLAGSRVNRKVMEALILSGAMDAFGKDRAVLLASLDAALQAADQHNQNQSSGIEDMFGLADSESPALNYLEARPMKERDRLQGEKDTLGLYLSGHPFDQYEKELRLFAKRRIADLKASDKVETICGLLMSCRVIMGRRGKMAFAQLDDRSGQIEIALYGDVYEQF